jgi:hypothetical protein
MSGRYYELKRVRYRLQNNASRHAIFVFLENKPISIQFLEMLQIFGHLVLWLSAKRPQKSSKLVKIHIRAAWHSLPLISA